jgi:hypothetical protein
VKKLVFGNRRITAFDLIICWKFHLAAFWKTTWTCMWFHHIYALPTGWGAEENWVRTLKRDWKPPFDLFFQTSVLGRDGDSMISPWLKQNHMMHLPTWKTVYTYFTHCVKWCHDNLICYIKSQGDYFEWEE